MSGTIEEQTLNDEIARLEAQLQAARAQRDRLTPQPSTTTTPATTSAHPTPPAAPNPTNDNALHPPSPPHALLLLSDSALPLGSFAFSSGLESYLAHHKPLPPLPPLHPFLRLSLASLAGTTIPYLIAAYRHPAAISRWDHDLDAATACPVARRASLAQGRALLSVWERALRSGSRSETTTAGAGAGATAALAAFSLLLKAADATANGHFAPLWSLVSRAVALSLEQTVYVFLFSHARAVLSAAVRAGVVGPYQAQGVLASAWLGEEIERGVRGNWDVVVEEAGQRVPVLDLWVGRHEVLYSRIFNS